jgi:hypothetical protein
MVVETHALHSPQTAFADAKTLSERLERQVDLWLLLAFELLSLSPMRNGREPSRPPALTWARNLSVEGPAPILISCGA